MAASSVPLAGLKVIELEGIGPGPLGACVLCDFGADVVTVCRADKGSVRSQGDPVSRGKRSIALDLKQPEALDALKQIVGKADVFIEPFRPGVCERMGLGPDVLMKLNPRLIYARMTGWGQGGDPKFEKLAGHDANYLALSGTLDFFGRAGDSKGPSPPANFAADYAGGGMMLAMGVLLAVIERQKSGLGQVIDVAMIDGANYVALPLFKWQQAGMIVPSLENGHVDKEKFFLNQAPHYCGIYQCADGEWVSVQAIESQFYKLLLQGLFPRGVPSDLPKQMDSSSWKWMKARFEAIFATKTRDEWAKIFYGVDACVVPVLTSREASKHPHHVQRKSFAPTPGLEGMFEPVPAPRLSRSPGLLPRPNPTPGEHTRDVLLEYGLSTAQVDKLHQASIATTEQPLSKL